MNRLKRIAERKTSKREQKIHRIIGLIIIDLAIAAYFWGAANNLAGRATWIAENPPIETAQASDPCDLEAVICAGEEAPRAANITTYNAEEAQTDADPYTMASGRRVYEGAAASNCHPIGTKIEIDGREYTIEDRMNRRYTEECGKPIITDQAGKYISGERIDLFKWDRSDNFQKIGNYKIIK